MAPLEATEKQEDDNDDKDYSHSPSGEIAPLPTVRPAGKSTYECQDQNDDQDGCQHCSLSFVNLAVDIQAPPSGAPLL